MPARLLSHGFRPLFLCATGAGLILIPLWIAMFLGLVDYSVPIPAVAWHGHEMLFGFGGAAVGGFLLTAVANWTGRPPVSGAWLATVVAAWLAARVAMSVDLGLGTIALTLADLGYWILLTGLMGREIIAARNWRNLKVVILLGLFTATTLIFHAGELFALDLDTRQVALRAAVMLFALLITLIGGRIVPAFTGNWLSANHPDAPRPAAFGTIDSLTFALTIIAAITWTLWPTQQLTGMVAVLAGLLQLMRLLRWCGHLTLAEPLLFVLHAGYAWLGCGFLLLGTSIFSGSVIPSAGIHALTAGAVTTMILAVAARAAKGHTGRPLTAGPWLSASFALIHAAAICRVAASMDMRLLGWSAGVWALAFLLYAVHIVPVLLGPRIDD